MSTAADAKLDKTEAPSIGGTKAHLAWLWRYWTGNKSMLLVLALLTFVSTAVAVAYPLVFRWVIDRINEVLGKTGELGRLGTVMLVLAGIALGRIIAGFYPATRALVNLRLDMQIREDVFGNLMEKDYRFNNAFRTGDVVTRLTDDIYEFPKIAWFGCSGIFRAVESSSKLIFCLAVMLSMSWKLTVLSVLPLPIMMYVFYSMRNHIRRYVKATQRAISKTNDLLEAAFAGIRIVKAFRAERGQEDRLGALMKERRGIFLKLMKIQVVLWSLDTLASRLGQMIVIAVGGYMVMRGEITIGTLFAFYIFLDMLAHPMMDLPQLFMSAQQAFVSMDRVEEIRSYPVTVPRGAGCDVREVRTIALDGVHFSYGGERNSIHNANFEVQAGERVAIVGPVASGKSTLLKLLAGILSPHQGQILVNGRPLGELDWDAYRRLLGYVPQEGVLFSQSIRENVVFGRPVPDGDEEPWARRWLAAAQMEDDLADLPEGLGTVVGQKGSLVSGGQKQRIAIARALAGRPQVLLLDDCTAALDARNEDRFWSRLDEELAGCTCFIVSHRLSTIRRADRILVLEDGALVDEGTHEELALRCETYREFLQTERRKEQLGVAGLDVDAEPEPEPAGA
jgi:ATP-binding cassette subfamily B multidrug efflux pump